MSSAEDFEWRHALDERVEILEQKVGVLELLPNRVTAVESQILQLRGEICSGFSAIDLSQIQLHGFIDAAPDCTPFHA